MDVARRHAHIRMRTIVIVYRIFYGEAFFEQSLQHLLDFNTVQQQRLRRLVAIPTTNSSSDTATSEPVITDVWLIDRIYVFWTDRPWTNVTHVCLPLTPTDSSAPASRAPQSEATQFLRRGDLLNYLYSAQTSNRAVNASARSSMESAQQLYNICHSGDSMPRHQHRFWNNARGETPTSACAAENVIGVPLPQQFDQFANVRRRMERDLQQTSDPLIRFVYAHTKTNGNQITHLFNTHVRQYALSNRVEQLTFLEWDMLIQPSTCTESLLIDASVVLLIMLSI